MLGYQWRITSNWKPYAKIGLASIMNDATGGPVPYDEQTSVQVAFGGGLKYDFSRRPWSVRGNMDWYDRDAWYGGLSVAVSFGRQTAVRTAGGPAADQERNGPAVGPDDACVAVDDESGRRDHACDFAARSRSRNSVAAGDPGRFGDEAG